MSPVLLRVAVVVAGATVLAFVPTLSADLVYDARLQILTDPFLHDARNWVNVLTFRVLGMDVLDFNRPVHLASLMLDAAIWGTRPFGYHLTSVLLHAANVVLVWVVARRLLAAGGAETPPPHALVPLLAAAFFAVHPLVAEAVCEPTFREDLLAAVFTLGAVVLAGPATTTGAAAGGRRGLACAACCLLAVASKESGIAAPFVLAAWCWAFRGDGAAGSRDDRFGWIAVGGGAAAAAAFLAARFVLEPSPSRIFETRPEYPGGSFIEAMKIAPRILALYVQLIVAPVNLCADYGGYSVRHLPLWLACAVLVACSVAAVFAGRRDRRVVFAMAVVLLPLVPVANLVPIYRAAADRYLYLPLAGVALLLVCLLDSPWVRARDRRRQAAILAAIAAIALLTVACLGRQRVWRTQLDLWVDTHARNPGSFNAASGLSAALRDAGRADEAVEFARRAVQMTDGHRGDAWITLALALDAAGRPAEADEAAAKAVEVDSRLADPDARVAALAMERKEADAVKTILARRSSN
ncbi:MAG: hypothetical protein ACKO4T_07350 [Planctomycetaceae bacterium]